MLVYRNQPSRRPSRRLGEVIIKERVFPPQIIASGRRSITMNTPSVCDWDGTPQIAALTNIVSLAVGLRGRGYLGVGNVIQLNWLASSRQITQKITIGSWGVQIDTETEYAQETDVFQDEYSLRINNWFPEIESDSMVIQSPSSLRICSDDGEETPNFVFSEEGNPIRSDYNTRNAEEKQKTSIRVLGDRSPSLRKALQPSGYEATLMFSNHSDVQNTDTCMAVLYGSNDVSNPAYGSKGFVPRGIKATWSSFYTTEGDNMGFETPEFKALMDELQAEGGYEICPHSVRNGRDDRADNVAYLPTFANDFPPFKTMIDHSLGGGWRSSGLKSLGWDKSEADYYIMDLMEQYDVPYAWSYKDFDRFTEVDGLNMLHDRQKGWPHYLLYQNTNLAWDNGTPMWQWPTWRELDGAIINRLSQTNIDNLIKNRGISSIHSYLASIHRVDQSYTVDNGLYVITEALDDALQRLSVAQSQGKLWIPTIREWGDYWRSVMKVEVNRTSKSAYRLTNNSGAEITGFGLVVNAPVTATIEGISVNRKQVESDSFIWFDLPAGESVLKLQQ